MLERKWLGIVLFCVGLLGIISACQSGENNNRERGNHVPKEETDNEEADNEEVAREAELETDVVEDTLKEEIDSREEMNKLAERSFKWKRENDYTYRLTDEDGQNRIFTQTYLETMENEKGIWDTWSRTFEDEAETNDIVIMEDDSGLYSGYSESEYDQSMQYPVKEGDTFEYAEETLTTVAENETITVAAGTFNHVAIVKTEDGTFMYLAPGAGTILTKNVDGDVLMELLEIT